MATKDKDTRTPDVRVGNTPEMWRQTVYFFVIPLAGVLALLWYLTD